MDMNLEVLNKITETAVKAAGMRDYDVSPLLKRHISADGKVHDIPFEPPPKHNELLDLQGCVAVYKRYDYEKGKAEVFVSYDEITIMHDRSRTIGMSVCKLIKSEAVYMILQHNGEDMKPEKFEKLAKLYFGADSQFINTIRKLQWKEQSDTTTRLSTVSKSADAHEIAKVVDKNEVLFQDITLTVPTPYFILPHETSVIEIDLEIYANPVTKTIAFATKPGDMLRKRHAATLEVLAALNKVIGSDVAILGDVVMEEQSR
jgi:hypothetical protein